MRLNQGWFILGLSNEYFRKYIWKLTIFLKPWFSAFFSYWINASKINLKNLVKLILKNGFSFWKINFDEFFTYWKLDSSDCSSMFSKGHKTETGSGCPQLDFAILATRSHNGCVGAKRNAGHIVEMALLLKNVGLRLPFPNQ